MPICALPGASRQNQINKINKLAENHEIHQAIYFSGPMTTLNRAK